jgi:hypothetical protein
MNIVEIVTQIVGPFLAGGGAVWLLNRDLSNILVQSYRPGKRVKHKPYGGTIQHTR